MTASDAPAGTFLTGLIPDPPVTDCGHVCVSHRCGRPCSRVAEHGDDFMGCVCDSCASAMIGWF